MLPGFQESAFRRRTPQSSDREQFKEILVMKCQRCFDDRRVVYRVTSDVINLRVGASCAAEAPRLGLLKFSASENQKHSGPALSETVDELSRQIAQAVIV